MHAAKQRIAGLVAADVAFLEHEIRIRRVLRDVFRSAAGQIVDRADREPALEKQVHHVASDEPRPAGDDANLAADHAAFSSLSRRTLK